MNISNSFLTPEVIESDSESDSISESEKPSEHSKSVQDKWEDNPTAPNSGEKKVCVDIIKQNDSKIVSFENSEESCLDDYEQLVLESSSGMAFYYVTFVYRASRCIVKSTV